MTQFWENELNHYLESLSTVAVQKKDFSEFINTLPSESIDKPKVEKPFLNIDDLKLSLAKAREKKGIF